MTTPLLTRPTPPLRGLLITSLEFSAACETLSRVCLSLIETLDAISSACSLTNSSNSDTPLSMPPLL